MSYAKVSDWSRRCLADGLIRWPTRGRWVTLGCLPDGTRCNMCSVCPVDLTETSKSHIFRPTILISFKPQKKKEEERCNSK